MPSVSREFASMAEFVEYAQGPSGMPNGSRTSRRTSSDDWAGASVTEAVALAHGWAEGAKRVEAMAARIRPKTTRGRRVAVMSEVGPGVYSMGALMAGHPQPFVTLRETNAPRRGKGKIVRVLVNCTPSASVNKRVIETRGAAVCALVWALEQAGRRVEVKAVWTVRSWTYKRTVIDYRITLKRAEDRLTMPTLAFALAHAAFVRRLVFSAQETESEGTRREMNMPARMGEPITSDHAADIYLDKMHGNEAQWSAEQSATAWVIEELSKQGVTLK